MQFNSHRFDVNCFFFAKKYHVKKFHIFKKFFWITNRNHARPFGAKESV